MTDIRQWITCAKTDIGETRSFDQIEQEWQAQYNYIAEQLSAGDQLQLAEFITWLLTYANSVE